MPNFYKKTNRTAISIWSWVLFPILITAQQTIHYRDTLQVGKYVGMADYHYKVVDNDTLLDGSFKMERSNLQALLELGDYSFLFQGRFENDYPEGDWKFQFGEFQSDSVTEVIDYQYRLNITGIQEEAKGKLTTGKPDGIWTIVNNRIKDSEIDETLFKSTIEFEKGIPQKSFRIQNTQGTLVGRFLRNGLAHDTWTLYSDEAIDVTESWHFTDGRLQRIEIQQSGETQNISFYTNPQTSSRTINLDQSYLMVLKIKQESNDTINLSNSLIYGLLHENATHYKKIDNILSELGKSSFLPEFKVKVPFYPLDSIAAAQLDSAQTLYYKSNTISETLLNNTQLKILKLSDAEVNFLYSTIGALTEDFLKPLGKIMDYKEQGILEFTPQKELIQHIWPDRKPNQKLTITDEDGNSRSFQGPNSEGFNFSGNNIESIYRMAQYANISLDSIQNILQEKLAQEQRQQEFIALEEKMIAQVNQLNQDLDSLMTGLPNAYKKALQKIGSTSTESLTRYSKMPETDTKKELGTHLVQCFAQMDTLAVSVAMQPDRLIEIKELYLDAVWNPFMATIMNEEVKKRIVSAYEKVLIPHILTTIENNLDCENAETSSQLIQSAYERMLEMREEDTSKLERKLRKERDPKVVIQLFNIEPSSDEGK